MSYQAGSFVADEQPTTAKWNLLWGNDASFNDGTGIGDDTIDSRHYVAGSIDPEHLASTVWGWEELGRATLSSTADSMSTGTITAKKYLKVLCVLNNSGAIQPLIRFNNDSGSNYSLRFSDDGAAQSTSASQSSIISFGSSQAFSFFLNFDVINLQATEKMLSGVIQLQNTAGAANVPGVREHFSKWANTSAQITRVDIINNGAGDFASGSELVVLGHD